jgi:hypothetical protein
MTTLISPLRVAPLALLLLIAPGLVARAGAQAAPTAAEPKPTAPLPTAIDVLSKYRTAIGGETAIRKHTSRTFSGNFEIPAQGMKGDLKIIAAAPDRMKLTIALGGLGDIERGYDGKIGWAIEPGVGPRLLQGRELDELKHSADFYDELHDPSKYSSVVVVGRGPFEGQECYEVKLVRNSGFTYNEFFDVNTGLLIGVKMNATSQMGTLPVTTVVSDYKAFDGVLTPTVTHQKMMGLELVTTINSVSYEPLSEAVFVPPPPIVALASEKK